MHGSADKAITMDQFAGLTKELESAGIAKYLNERIVEFIEEFIDLIA